MAETPFVQAMFGAPAMWESLALPIREAGDDDHFYGVWKRGGTMSGAAMAKQKARQRAAKRERAERDSIIPDVDNLILSKAAEMTNLSVENLYAFDERFGEVFHRVGDEHGVPISGSDFGRLGARHLLHNHPPGTPLPLSPDDIETASVLNAASVSVVGTTVDGRRVLVRLHRPPGGWEPVYDTFVESANDLITKVMLSPEARTAARQSADMGMRYINESAFGAATRATAERLGARLDEVTL